MTSSVYLDVKAPCHVIINIIAILAINTNKLVSVCNDRANLLAGKDAGSIKLLKSIFPT